jgi:hypothetical protein
MKKLLLSLLVVIVAATAQAKSWKIGPSSVTGMDFASINAAMSSSNVAAGDTLYLDQYYNESAEQTVTKKVVIIGTGYDTSLTDEQVVATLTNYLYLKANYVEVKSVKLKYVYFFNDECILDRCYLTSASTLSSTAGMNHIYSCYVEGSINGQSSSPYSQYDIQNCVVSRGGTCINYLNNSIINNNTIICSTSDYCINNVTNSQITNNILLNTNSSYYGRTIGNTASGSGNTIEHNILSNTSALTYYPTNKLGFGSKSSELFTQTGNFSDYYKLADKSAAKGYATDGGECGCHGGMFGCPSGGRPQYIPYFTKVTVGSRSEDGKLPVSISVKIQEE